MATHAQFDEGMNNLPIDKIPPNVQLLRCSEFGPQLPAEATKSTVDKFHLFSSPFAHTIPKTLEDQCYIMNFGLNVDTD